MLTRRRASCSLIVLFLTAKIVTSIGPDFMPHHKSAAKRIKTNKKANLRNREYRAVLRNALRKVAEGGQSPTIDADLRKAAAVLDRLVGKGIIHRNTAARRKSGLQRLAARAKTEAGGA